MAEDLAHARAHDILHGVRGYRPVGLSKFERSCGVRGRKGIFLERLG